MNAPTSTNRQDPESIKSRIFVGNLNTVKMPRAEFEQIFSQYGEILGISMHRGYAFVQYSNEYEARFAVDNEDAKNYYGKDIDVTVASEPKNRKRVRSNITNMNMNSHISKPQMSKSGIVDLMAVKTAPTFPNQFSNMTIPNVISNPTQLNMFSNFINQQPMTNFTNAFQSNLTSKINNSSGAKRTRLDGNNSSSMTHLNNKTCRNLVPIVTNQPKPMNRTSGNSVYRLNRAPTRNLVSGDTSEDILLCGKCRKCFDSVEDLMTHKLAGCNIGKKTRSDTQELCKAPGEPSSLNCAYCGQNYFASWDLINHCEEKHDIKIYSLPEKKTNFSGDDNSNDKNSLSKYSDQEESRDQEASGSKRKTGPNYSPSNVSESSYHDNFHHSDNGKNSCDLLEPKGIDSLVDLCEDDCSEESEDKDDQNDEINLKLSTSKLASKRKTESPIKISSSSESYPRNRMRGNETSRHEATISSGDESDRDNNNFDDQDQVSNKSIKVETSDQ